MVIVISIVSIDSRTLPSTALFLIRLPQVEPDQPERD